MLHSSIGIGIGIARGQYYWILGVLFGIVLTLLSIRVLRGAPDLDPDPAGYPVFFQDPIGSGSGRIQKY